ncbi:MAG: hypothetical protein RIQ33_758 [Bacteroidota bacterium]|jgi:fibronectin type 3 domain-containing protein
MKYILTSLSAMLIFVSAFAQQKVTVKVASNGLAVFCGNEIPSSLHYKIERKATDETDFQFIEETFMPTNLNAFKGRLSMWNATCPFYEPPTFEKAGEAFAALQTHQTMDSVFYYNGIPLYYYASGTAYLDVNVQEGKSYVYRVTYNGASKQSDAVMYKPQALQAKAKFRSKTILGSIIQLKYFVKTKDRNNLPHVAKVYRSNNLQTPLLEADASCGFQFKGDSLFAIMNDTLLNKNFYYSYCIQMFDKFGNASEMSDTVSLLDKYENTLPLVYLYAHSDAKKNGIRLSWNFKKVDGLRSIDIYKSTQFDGDFKMIHSSTANDTAFMDNDVQPIISYYYFIQLNGSFEKGAQSAKVSGMLKTEHQPLAPQQIKAKQKNNGVEISWQLLDPSTRGYYVFRGLNYHPTKFEQVSGLILAKENETSFLDTIGLNYGKVYSYCVKAVSNDYTIGKASDTVGVSFMKTEKQMDMQAPSSVFVKQMGNAAKIVWQRDTLLRKTTAYELLRREVKTDNSKTNWQTIATALQLKNHSSFTDSTIKIFTKYEYTVKAFYGSQSSEQSVATQFEMEYEKPLAPLVVEAFNLNNAVVLRWEKSEISNLKSYKIYRVNHIDAAEKLIATINSTENSYTDKSVIIGNEYGYYIIAVDKNSVESVKSSEVGVMVK